jgi:hypothetical protein
MIKTLVFLIFLLQSMIVFSQDPDFSIDLKTVDVVEERDRKVKTIGKHKVFSLFLNTYSLENIQEIAALLRTEDSYNYWVQKAFMRVELNEKKEDEVPIIFRLRAVSDDGLPEEVVFQDTLNLMENLKGKVLEVDLQGRRLSLDSNGIFISLEAINKEDRKVFSIEMTSGSENTIICTKSIFDAPKWRKVLYSKESKKMSLKGGLQLLQK